MKQLSLAGALTALAIFVWVPSATAQRANSLEDGAWALQFGVQGQFISVNTFAGGLSLKRHFSPQSAIRLGISANTQDTDWDYSYIEDVAGTNRWSTGVNVTYQHYVNPDADAIVYWGVGPTFDYSRDSATSSHGDSLSSDSTRKYWSVGADAVLGVEWFATHAISFQAEYVAGFDYNSLTDVTEINNYGDVITRQANRDGWSSSLASGVRFGLSVYF